MSSKQTNCPRTLSEAAASILETSNPAAKVKLSHDTVKAWQSGAITSVGSTALPDRPPSPDAPALLPMAQMRKRPKGSMEGRAAFIHAIAHIEFTAINLAWDIVGRFHTITLPTSFYDDWVMVAYDEVVHFCLLQDRLGDLGYVYGDFPAHDGLWDAAQSTADDVLARLAIIPMVLEARGLDTTPKAIAGLEAAGDQRTADLMAMIGREEIPHVRAGVRWFEFVCNQKSLEPVSTFHRILAKRFKGKLKPPFNHEMRQEAGMKRAYYDPIPAG